AGAGLGGAAVGRGHRADDGEAEPRAPAAARLVGAREALEGPLGEAGRKAAALVGDVELDAVRERAGEEGDVAAAVDERVVDEVVERLLDPRPVGVERRVLRLGRAR